MRSDGSLCVGPVALAELQAHRFDALREMADLARRRPDLVDRLHASPEGLDRAADDLRRSVLSWFFPGAAGQTGSDGAGLADVAYGVERWQDGSLVPLRVRKSNIGHLLSSGILDGPEYGEQVAVLVQEVLDPSHGLVCPVGIRTLGSRERLFRPGAYHDGTVWPWDTAWIARGLLRHGYHRCGSHLLHTVLRVCRELRYYPEHVRGEDGALPHVNERITVIQSKDPHFGAWNIQVEQPPQMIQGWTVMAYLMAVGELNFPLQARRKTHRTVAKLDQELAGALGD
jgi:glycogen debranching enzyme